jgi:hypothetical protein
VATATHGQFLFLSPGVKMGVQIAFQMTFSRGINFFRVFWRKHLAKTASKSHWLEGYFYQLNNTPSKWLSKVILVEGLLSLCAP